MASIFVNYRRADAGGWAQSVYDRLAARFGADQVFIDLDDIPAGEDFTQFIADRLRDMDVVVTVIGRDWLTVADSEGRPRIHNPDDLLRREISIALELRIRVVPVLVEGGSMPKASDLPDDIQGLSRLNAFELTPSNFDTVARNLVDQIDNLIGGQARREGSAVRNLLSNPGVVTVLGAAVVVGALFWSGVLPPTSATTTTTAVGTPTTTGTDLTTDPLVEKVQAEQIATQWLMAVEAADVESLVALSPTPFYFDDGIYISSQDLHDKYEDMVGSLQDAIQVDRFDTWTIAEARDLGYTDDVDVIADRMTISDRDYAVVIQVGEDFVLFVVRHGPSGLEIAGFWD